MGQGRSGVRLGADFFDIFDFGDPPELKKSKISNLIEKRCSMDRIGFINMIIKEQMVPLGVLFISRGQKECPFEKRVLFVAIVPKGHRFGTLFSECMIAACVEDSSLNIYISI